MCLENLIHEVSMSELGNSEKFDPSADLPTQNAPLNSYSKSATQKFLAILFMSTMYILFQLLLLLHFNGWMNFFAYCYYKFLLLQESQTVFWSFLVHFYIYYCAKAYSHCLSQLFFCSSFWYLSSFSLLLFFPQIEIENKNDEKEFLFIWKYE